MPTDSSQPKPSLRVRTGFRYLYVLDACALMAIMILTMVARFGTSWPSVSTSKHLLGFAAATAIHLVVFYFAGLYDRGYRLGRRTWISKVATAEAIALVLAALVVLPTDRYPIPRANLPAVGILSILAVIGLRGLSRQMRTRRYGPPQVLIVGDAADAAMATKHLVSSDRDAAIVGIVSETERLAELAEETGATDILLVSDRGLSAIYPSPLNQFEKNLTGVYQRVESSDLLLGLKHVREVGGIPFVTLRSHALPPSQLRLKRMMDLLIVLIILLPLLPVIALTAIYVKAKAGSGIIYHQMRAGQDGKEFKMLKFRTMSKDAEAGRGEVKATRSDPRVIPGLAPLRKYRLDELPQIWNVIKGEMSLVGPRPERPGLTQQYENEITGYTRRLTVPPGITGLAQIRGEYDTDPAYKLGHDIQYIVNWSPFLDIAIIVRTIPAALRSAGS